MPVVSLGDGIPTPVGGFEVFKDDARFRIALRRIAPDVVITPSGIGRGAPRPLKPDVLVGRVVENELGDYAQSARMGFA